MKNRKSGDYRLKVQTLTNHIQSHLDEEISLADLAANACFSKFHLHRLFTAFAGISLGKFIQLARLRRASYQLIYAAEKSVTDIAFDARFENVESFSRAFKKAFGQTPSDFRGNPAWEPWRETFNLPIFAGDSDMQVNIIDFKSVHVAALEHKGHHDRLHESLKKFVEWRQLMKLTLEKNATYNVVYGDPNVNYPEDWDPEAFRMDLCCAVSGEIGSNDYGIVNKVIPGGRCAVLRHLGSSDNIEDSVLYLYRQWLPNSGETLRDFPCFFHRVSLFPAQVPEHEQITDVYLPIQ